MKDIPRDWSFDVVGVAEQFDDHVRESLPWYDLVTRAVAHVARHYLTDGGLVYDVGASTGNIAKALNDVILSRRATYVGIEKSEAMYEVLRSTLCLSGRTQIVQADATELSWGDKDPADVIVVFLTAMFFPPHKRLATLDAMYRRLRPGGVMIVVDKCEPADGYPAIVLSRLALAEKLSVGVPAQEIIDKELSLSGAQRPINPAVLPGLPVEFFRMGDFAGWIIESPEVA